MTEPRDLDVRVVHRNIQKGRLSEKDFASKLEALPDLESEAEFVDYEQRFEEDAKHEAGPPPPVFVGASPPPSFAPAPAPTPTPEPDAPAEAQSAPAPTESSSSEPSPEAPRSGGFGTGTGWGSGGTPGGFGGSTF